MPIYLASNPFFASFGQSDLFGKFIFISLFFLSILSWSLLIFKILLARRSHRQGALAAEQLALNRHRPLNLEIDETATIFFTLYKKLRMGALELLNKNKAVLGDGAIHLSNADIELLGSHLDNAITQETRGLRKNLFILSTVVSLAPFLGLLGTVWGILITFSELQARVSAAANDMVMSGLSMALATTVLGLLVAIPALIGNNYLRASIRDLSIEMRDFASTALAAVELQYRKVDVA